MRIQELMSKPAVTCSQDDSLNIAARLMWEHDCGALPVLGEDGKVVGMLTDRDICMAAYTQGKPLAAMRVASAMARQVHFCLASESIEAAERLMTDKRIRRLPVLDEEGRPVGVLSLNDLARGASSEGGGNGAQRDVARTLAAICQPRRARPEADSAAKTGDAEAVLAS
jgi:CBS domain-containing protein